jgi:hypothetical protein
MHDEGCAGRAGSRGVDGLHEGGRGGLDRGHGSSMQLDRAVAPTTSTATSATV